MTAEIYRSLEETYGTLEELRKEGKIKYIGVSECNANTLRKIAKVNIIALRFDNGLAH